MFLRFLLTFSNSFSSLIFVFFIFYSFSTFNRNGLSRFEKVDGFSNENISKSK